MYYVSGFSCKLLTPSMRVICINQQSLDVSSLFLQIVTGIDGGGLEVYGLHVITKTIAVRFFASGPSNEPLPLLQSLFTTCPGRTGLYAYSLFPCIPGDRSCTQTSVRLSIGASRPEWDYKRSLVSLVAQVGNQWLRQVEIL